MNSVTKGKIKHVFTILGCTLAIAAAAVMLLLAYQYDLQRSDQSARQKAISDSLIAENIQLRQLLEAKLESLCDTMTTVTEKLAQVEFDAFCLVICREQETEELKAYNEKEAASLAAYQEKETKDNAVFDEYYATRCRALEELEKNNPSACDEYAIAVYKTDRCAYTYDDFQEMRKLEEDPDVAKYLAADRDAWQKREAEGGKLEAAYTQQNAKIDQDYENRLRDIKKAYELKIAAKKESLGL